MPRKARTANGTLRGQMVVRMTTGWKAAASIQASPFQPKSSLSFGGEGDVEAVAAIAGLTAEEGEAVGGPALSR